MMSLQLCLWDGTWRVNGNACHHRIPTAHTRAGRRFTAELVVSGLPANARFDASVQVTTAASQCVIRNNAVATSLVATVDANAPTPPPALSFKVVPGAVFLAWGLPRDRGGVAPQPYVCTSTLHACTGSNTHTHTCLVTGTWLTSGLLVGCGPPCWQQLRWGDPCTVCPQHSRTTFACEPRTALARAHGPKHSSQRRVSGNQNRPRTCVPLT